VSYNHGEGWQGVRDGVAADQGWPLYLQRYPDRMARERQDTSVTSHMICRM
jgi:hypothetical protein